MSCNCDACGKSQTNRATKSSRRARTASARGAEAGKETFAGGWGCHEADDAAPIRSRQDDTAIPLVYSFTEQEKMKSRECPFGNARGNILFYALGGEKMKEGLCAGEWGVCVCVHARVDSKAALEGETKG